MRILYVGSGGVGRLEWERICRCPWRVRWVVEDEKERTEEAHSLVLGVWTVDPIKHHAPSSRVMSQAPSLIPM